MDHESLWMLDANSLRKAFSAGRTTPAKVLESVLERCDEINGSINAIVTFDVSGARRAAHDSTQRWLAGAPISELDGIPFTVKDNLYVGQSPTSWGSRLYEGFIAPRDDLPVAALKQAGAVLLGKTNTPELAMAGYTDNLVFGSTGNPWRPDWTPGGSSGGAAAAVSAGMGVFAIGTDAGGSIRKPASHTGVLGLKPGIGRILRRDGFPALAHDLQVIGLISRSVADLQSLFCVMTGDALKPRTAKMARCQIGAFLQFPESTIGAQVDPEVVQAFERGLDVLRTLGHEVSIIDPLWDPQQASTLFNGLVNAGIARVVTRHAHWEDMVGEAVARMAHTGLEMSAVDYVRLLDNLADFRRGLREKVEAYDFILTPTTPTIGWSRTDASPARIGALPARPGAVGAYTAGVSLSGLPALSIPAPCGLHDLPVGMQWIAPSGDEDSLLHLASDYERQSPWRQVADDCQNPSIRESEPAC